MLKSFYIALPNTITNVTGLLTLLNGFLAKKQANYYWLLDDQPAFLLFVYDQTESTFALTVAEEVETWYKQYETIEEYLATIMVEEELEWKGYWRH